MTDTEPDPDRAALAAEMALGLLEAGDRAAALRLYSADPAFATEVERWSERLASLLDTVPATAPSPRVWRAIEARIGTTSSRERNHLRLWQGATALCGTLAASLALFLVFRTQPALPPVSDTQPMAISQLVGTGPAAVTLVYDPARAVLRVQASSLQNTDKHPELWIIPADGVPRSLGIVPRGRPEISVPLTLRPLLSDGTTMAVTMEDPATAPHAAPTSAPILTGKISVL